MIETILLSVLITLLVVAILGVSFHVLYSLLKSKLSAELNLQISAIKTDQQSFFSQVKAEMHQKEAELLEKIPKINKNEFQAGSPESEKKNFWEDLDAMEKAKEQIADGNFEDYQDLPELNRLMPLDAVRYIDEAILKEREQRGMASPN